MGQGFKQRSGVDQGGNPWYDIDAEKDVEPYVDKNLEKYAEILHHVPISLMIEILTKFGYRVIDPAGNERTDGLRK